MIQRYLVRKLTFLQPVWFRRLTSDTRDTVRFQRRWQASTMPKMRFSAEFTCKYLPLSHWGKALWGSVLSYKTPDVTNSCCCCRRQNNRPHCHRHSTRRLSGDSQPAPLLRCRRDEPWLQAAPGGGGWREALKALHSLSTSKATAACVRWDWKLIFITVFLTSGSACSKVLCAATKEKLFPLIAFQMFATFMLGCFMTAATFW